MRSQRFRKIVFSCVFVFTGAVLCSCNKSKQTVATVVAEASSVAVNDVTVTTEADIVETQPVETTSEEMTTEVETSGLAETSQEESEQTAESSVAETAAETTTAETTTAEPTTVETTIAETTVPETTAPPPTTTEAPSLSYEERMSLMNTLILQNMPGIVCWGDSLTYGYGGEGVSYPTVLKNLMSERLTDLVPVINNGICMETTHSIMARAGKLPLVVSEVTLNGDRQPTHIRVHAPADLYINIGSAGAQGLNPVTINGVMGELKGDSKSDDHRDFLFTRYEDGDPVDVPDGTPVITYGSYAYPGHVNILFMGQNGIYSTPQELVEQTATFINGLDNDRYIVIGLTTGDNSSRLEIDNLMEATFGAKYIRTRQELCDKGKMYLNMPEDDGDWFNKQEGIVYGSFMSDDIHLNFLGYIALGYIVYDRMDALGYFNDIKGYIAKYNY